MFCRDFSQQAPTCLSKQKSRISDLQLCNSKRIIFNGHEEDDSIVNFAFLPAHEILVHVTLATRGGSDKPGQIGSLSEPSLLAYRQNMEVEESSD